MMNLNMMFQSEELLKTSQTRQPHPIINSIFGNNNLQIANYKKCKSETEKNN